MHQAVSSNKDVPDAVKYNGNLSVLYLNADRLLNKRHDLKFLIKSFQKPPDVIATTEFKPKRLKHQLFLSELNIEGYNIYREGLENNDGRGGIKVSLVEIPLAFQECLFLMIRRPT